MTSSNIRVQLNLKQDILCLYTPYAHSSRRLEHTRSTLLQRRNNEEGENTLFTIVSSITFNLVITVSHQLPIDTLLRFLILSYTRYAYGDLSQESNLKKHASLYNEGSGVSKQALQSLYRADLQNRENYQYCMTNRVFNDIPETKEGNPAIPWTWLIAGDERITNTLYREMRNINFIRDVTEIDIHNDEPSLVGEKQYKIQLDNHLILLYLLKKLRFGQITIPHNEIKLKYSVRLLDPICSLFGKYELFIGNNNHLSAYIEKQLNTKRNPLFIETLFFKQSYTWRGGLVQASLHGENTQKIHTISEMFSQATSSTTANMEVIWDQAAEGGFIGIKKKQQPQDSVKKVGKEEEFKIRHNPLYIDLSAHEYIHVKYFDGTKTVACHDPTPIKKIKKLGSTTTVVIKESRWIDKKQPLLRGFIDKIPEDSKRKYEPELVQTQVVEEERNEQRPMKIQRTQATLNQFFK